MQRKRLEEALVAGKLMSLGKKNKRKQRKTQKKLSNHIKHEIS